MKIALVLTCALAVGKIHCTGWPDPNCGQNVERNWPKYIVGGWRAELGDFPWQVLVGVRRLYTYKLFLCGGSIITRGIVLTAAHCLHRISLKDSYVEAGFVNRRRKGPYHQKRNVSILDLQHRVV
ncbi:trypsin epsilon-like [Ixodes scapularis]|uniref:trypsin epsilon-like n=1 Tax=Ixodes scapularis TaxID=6945 RepID=UPI001A9DC076|nr:trypsin epsilon-like [Ixodes scapularis]